MGKTKREPSRADAFHKHYAAIWGEARWNDSLYPALARPTRHAALTNRALPSKVFKDACEAAQLPLEDLEAVIFPGDGGPDGPDERPDTCMTRKPDVSSDETSLLPQPCATGNLMSHWNMDAASVLAAKLLGVTPGDKVLDVCAAPGGKSIALAQDLFYKRDGEQLNGTSLLCSNEADKPRFRRLAQNLQAYLPSGLHVKCTNIDATSSTAHRELTIADGWDEVLVDAPCSSERHIIHAHIKAQTSGRAAPEMANWRPGSTKRLQETQVRLLLTALRLLKDHGSALYATCSIEPGENDGLVDKVLAQIDKESKKGLIGWGVKLESFSAETQKILEQKWAERTKHGWIMLPDHPGNGRWGPLYFTRLVKVPRGG